MSESARTDHSRHDTCISACHEKAKLGIDHGWCDVCATARAEALAAEVAQLRQQCDTFAQRNATQALTIHAKREAWFAEKTRADKAEAARDHLRARLRQRSGHWQAMNVMEDGRYGVRTLTLAERQLLDWCAADLLAILEAPSEPPTEEKEKDLDARVGTMGDGDTSRTASAVQAGSEEPITLNQERNKP